jgi:hypothetical protein
MSDISENSHFFCSLLVDKKAVPAEVHRRKMSKSAVGAERKIVDSTTPVSAVVPNTRAQKKGLLKVRWQMLAVASRAEFKGGKYLVVVMGGTQGGSSK